MTNPRRLTTRQRREIQIAVRHLGRALKAMSRADVPLGMGYEGWLHALNRGERSIGVASDWLIDGLEAEPTVSEESHG